MNKKLRPALSLLVLAAFLISAGCMQPGPAAQETLSPSPTTVALQTNVPAGATREEMVAFVDEAVSYAKEHGRTAALAEFSNRNGAFVRGELYIYAYDFNGTTIAHPLNPEKIGVSRYDEPDTKGT